MSNKHYDLSTDAEEEEEVLDVVRAKSPDKAEDDEHNQTHIHQQHQLSFDNNVQAGEEEEHQGEREHLPDSPHNLEGEIHQPHSNREDEIDEGVQLTNRSGQQFQQRQLTPEIEGTPRTRRDSTVVAEAQQQEEEEEEEEEEAEIERSLMEEPKPTHKGHLEKMEHSQQSEDKQEEEEEDEDEDEGTTSQHAATENLYDAAEFQNLPVGTDIKELFQFITAYAAQVIETETVLKPFILDFIPSVGDIDAFIKVTRPDDADDSLGLTVLDEPAAEQSDPTVLDLRMRAVSKGHLEAKDVVVKRVGRADKSSKEIEGWMKNIGELHKSKPATTVHYSRAMPDIDTLMQEWPNEMEDVLRQVELPTADMDVTLEQYVDTVCALLDIPVHKSRIQSLHVLFSLYSEFKNSQHFKSALEQGGDSQPDPAPNADTLVL